MKKYHRLFLGIVILFIITAIAGYFYYRFLLSSPSSKENVVLFEVEERESLLTIADELKTLNLIRSPFAYKLYIKLHHIDGLQAGAYELNTSMDVPSLLKILSGKSKNTNVIRITFKEGIHMRSVASLLAKNTKYSEEDVYDLLADETFQDKMIQKYWFLTDEIKNKEIYYSLEGYLFPNTYEFNKNASLEEIFMTLLDGTETILNQYKSDINQSSYTVHEILTLASIVELEAAGSNDRAGIAGVFYNRLENNWSLGSDVTTYYAIQVDMNERGLYKAELDDYNAYNTRSTKMAGKLPVSPICNPGEDAIAATIQPTKHSYFYLVADKNKTTYFSRTATEHTSRVNELKETGLWYEH